MKKAMIVFLLFMSAFIVGCSNINNQESDLAFSEDVIATKLATSMYLSQGLLVNNTMVENTSLMLNVGPEAQINSRLDQMLMYFDRVNVFIGQSETDALNIDINESSRDGYDHQVSYSLEGQLYVIHYNILTDNEEEQMFDLEGVIEFDNKTYEVIGGTEIEEGETELFFQTSETDDENYVRVEVEQETNEEYFQVETSIDGSETYSEIRLEKDGVDGAVEIYIEENGIDAYYEITKEVDGPFTIYYFDYSIGDTSGSIQLTEYLVDGQEVQHFIIEEDDYYDEYTIPENSIVPDDM